MQTLWNSRDTLPAYPPLREDLHADAAAQAPWFRYRDDAGALHEVWFEDARSMDAKLRLIAEYGFLGAGFWNLMRPFSQTWLTLASLYDIDSL